MSDKEAAIADAQEGIPALIDEIANLAAGIKALDQSVSPATEQRRSEHDNFNEFMASDSAHTSVTTSRCPFSGS